jgi:hypothetical protein
MTANLLITTQFLTGEAFTTHPPDNENLRLMPDWETPAEFMQWVRREQERLRRQMAADPRLLTCPEHRRKLNVRLAMEKVCLSHYYGVREG